MAREGLRYELSAAFQKAVHQKETVTLMDLFVGTDSGGVQKVNLTIQPIQETGQLLNMVMIVFHDIATPTARKPRGKSAVANASDDITALKNLLDATRFELQSARELMQTSQEELRSTNEELQSTN
jgi:two-component system CheB/CheR fusion protein